MCLPLPCPFCLQTNPFNNASTSDGQVWEAQCCVHFSIPAGLLGTLSQCRLGLSTSEVSLTSAQGCWWSWSSGLVLNSFTASQHWLLRNLLDLFVGKVCCLVWSTYLSQLKNCVRHQGWNSGPLRAGIFGTGVKGWESGCAPAPTEALITILMFDFSWMTCFR